MGTTCSALLLLPAGALVAHVGDSRVYRMRRDRIDQLSFDHSLVWELVRRNHLTSEQANLSVPKNVITRSLGPEVEIEVDVEGPLAVELGDVYLLCSDGLSGPVDDREIGAFGANFHPRDACRYLVNLANLRGGLDNITVLIVRIGQWVDPDSAETLNEETPKKSEHNGSRRGWRAHVSELFNRKRRNAELALVEDHPYRTYECPIDDALIDRLDELTRNIQEQAVAQAWSLDWAALASLRRQAADARAAKNQWVSLRKIAEIISLLGQAARFFRKNAGPPPSMYR
jgi:protein phosphatase